jgi:hypothetical protein
MRWHVAIFKDSPRNQLGPKICGKVRRHKGEEDTGGHVFQQGNLQRRRNRSSEQGKHLTEGVDGKKNLLFLGQVQVGILAATAIGGNCVSK